MVQRGWILLKIRNQIRRVGCRLWASVWDVIRTAGPGRGLFISLTVSGHRSVIGGQVVCTVKRQTELCQPIRMRGTDSIANQNKIRHTSWINQGATRITDEIYKRMFCKCTIFLFNKANFYAGSAGLFSPGLAGKVRFRSRDRIDRWFVNWYRIGD